jgi:hypothetical protein
MPHSQVLQMSRALRLLAARGYSPGSVSRHEGSAVGAHVATHASWSPDLVRNAFDSIIAVFTLQRKLSCSHVVVRTAACPSVWMHVKTCITFWSYLQQPDCKRCLPLHVGLVCPNRHTINLYTYIHDYMRMYAQACLRSFASLLLIASLSARQRTHFHPSIRLGNNLFSCVHVPRLGVQFHSLSINTKDFG